MSQSVEINGIEFITTREAAKVANYSNDYISKLARDGRVKGMQLGRQWFVDPISLQNFLEQTKVEKELRSEALRRERALERTMKETQAIGSEKVGDAVASAYSTLAAVQACLILTAGFLAGGAFWLSNSLVAEITRAPQERTIDRPSQLAQVPGRSASGATVQETTVLSEEGGDVSSNTEMARSGYLLLAQNASNVDGEELADLFSDEVIVEYADQHTGTVTPIFRDGNGTAVRFIEVPVKPVVN